MTLEIDTLAFGDHYVVVPRGELDLSTQGILRSALTNLLVAGHVDLVVDLNEVSFMDSTGLGALIAARRQAHTLRGSFALVCANEPLKRLFDATHLTKVFAFHDSREAATGQDPGRPPA
jgi:anti-sigma B factor antagonist